MSQYLPQRKIRYLWISVNYASLLKPQNTSFFSNSYHIFYIKNKLRYWKDKVFEIQWYEIHQAHNECIFFIFKYNSGKRRYNCENFKGNSKKKTSFRIENLLFICHNKSFYSIHIYLDFVFWQRHEIIIIFVKI